MIRIDTETKDYRGQPLEREPVPTTAVDPATPFRALGFQDVVYASGPTTGPDRYRFRRGDTDGVFFRALDEAFSRHHAFALRPEVVMQVVATQVATCIRRDPERYRHLLGPGGVIKIRHDGLHDGPCSAWQDVPEMFSRALGGLAPELVAAMTPELSTHDAVSRAAAAVAVMDAASPYYSFGVMTLCGIPEVHVHGTPQDWGNVHSAVCSLRELLGPEAEIAANLDVAVARVCDVYLHVSARAEGRESPTSFWRRIYQRSHGSGRNTFDGWAADFVAYVFDDDRLVRRAPGTAIDIGSVPAHASSVPFTWEIGGATRPMRFVAGVVACGVEDGALSPRCAFAVVTEA